MYMDETHELCKSVTEHALEGTVYNNYRYCTCIVNVHVLYCTCIVNVHVLLRYTVLYMYCECTCIIEIYCIIHVL